MSEEAKKRYDEAACRYEELSEKFKQLAQECREKDPFILSRDYTFQTVKGGISLSSCFEGKDDLIVIHNMGIACSWCTMTCRVSTRCRVPRAARCSSSSRASSIWQGSRAGRLQRSAQGHAHPKDDVPTEIVHEKLVATEVVAVRGVEEVSHLQTKVDPTTVHLERLRSQLQVHELVSIRRQGIDRALWNPILLPHQSEAGAQERT